MTIRRGDDWGERAPLPSDIVVVSRDQDATNHLRDGRPVLLSGGDMFRTLGGTGTGPAEAGEGVRVTLDLMRVVVRGVTFTALSHVVIRRPWWRGGPFRRRVTAVMNAQYMGDRDIAPRGHPNDGRMEIVEVDSSTRARQRLAAWRRARTGTHLPHPSITVRSATSFQATVDDHRSVVIVDGVRVGTCGRSPDGAAVELVADAAVAWYV